MENLTPTPGRRKLSFSLIFLVIGVILTSTTIIETLAITHALSNDVRASQASEIHFNPAENAESNLLIGYLDQETGLRGYVLTGDTTFLSPFVSGTKQVENAYLSLTPALAPYRQLAKQLNVVQSDGRNWEISAALHEIVPSLNESGLQSAVQASLQQDKKSFDALRSKINALRSSTISTDQAARFTATQALAKLKDTVIISGLVSLLVILTIAILFGYLLVMPMRRLERIATTVAGGSLGSVVELRGVREITSLSSSIERMRLGILSEMDLQRKSALLDAQYRERREVAQAIHDNPLQLLAAAKIRLQMSYPFETYRISNDRAIELIDRASSWMRNMIANLYPLGLVHADFEQAVREHLASMELGTSQSISADIDLGSLKKSKGHAIPALLMAFRCVQELTANAVKGASGGTISLFVRATENEMRICSINAIEGDNLVALRELANELRRSSKSRSQKVGHLGIPLLSDSIEAIGGVFTVRIFDHSEITRQRAIIYKTAKPWSGGQSNDRFNDDNEGEPWLQPLRQMQTSQTTPLAVITAIMPFVGDDTL